MIINKTSGKEVRLARLVTVGSNEGLFRVIYDDDSVEYFTMDEFGDNVIVNYIVGEEE